jgi:hypothetical protein
MSDPQLADVARFCNRYPDIEMEHALQGGAGAAPGDPVTVEVTLRRAQEGDVGPVDAARWAVGPSGLSERVVCTVQAASTGSARLPLQ